MFKKAERHQKKLKLAIAGPSGSGKTYSALRIATGIASKLNGRIAFIDTEHSSSSIYADTFDFDKIDLTDETPIPEYIKAIKAAGAEGYKVLIIDSMSHAWDSLKGTVDMVAAAKYRGNNFAAWGDKNAGKLYGDFIRAILASPCHIIACIRVKTLWEITKDENGKTKPIKIGLTPQQRANIEYEFDIFMEGDLDHNFLVSNTRFSKFDQAIINMPGEDFGISLLQEVSNGKLVDDDVLKQEIAAVKEAKTIDELMNIYEMSPFQNDEGFLKVMSERKNEILKGNG